MGSSLSALIFSVKQEGRFSAEREGVGKWQLEGKRRVHGVAGQKSPSKMAILIIRMVVKLPYMAKGTLQL